MKRQAVSEPLIGPRLTVSEISEAEPRGEGCARLMMSGIGCSGWDCGDGNVAHGAAVGDSEAVTDIGVGGGS